MLTRAELHTALQALGRVIRLDEDGFKMFDASYGGFWKSFTVIFFLVPIIFIQNLADSAEGELKGSFLLQSIGDFLVNAISWLLFPLVMLLITRIIDRKERFYVYAVSYNWFQLFAFMIMLPLILFSQSGGLNSSVGLLLQMMLSTAVLLYGWFIAKKALNIGGGTAAAVVILDIILSGIVHMMGLQMSGGIPPMPQ